MLRPSILRIIACTLLATALVVPARAAQEARWTEVRSPNFRVITDAGPGRGREVALRFEQIRAVFGTLTGDQQVSLPSPLEIVAFRRTREFAQVSPIYNGKPIKASGVFVAGDDRNFIALDLSVDDPWRVVYHEYAHLLMDANFARTQAWFDEGFSGYYEALEVTGRSATLGRDPARYMQRLAKARFMPVTELFAITQQSREYNEGDRRGLFYAQSWLAVHYLVDTGKLPLANTYFELVEKDRLPVEKAIEQAFGMSAQKFDEELQDYFRSRRAQIKSIERPAGLNELGFEAKPLDGWEARAVIADMRLHHPHYAVAAEKDFQEILAARPENATAHRGLGRHHLAQGEYAKAAQHFRRAAAADATDAQVHYYLGMLAPVTGKGPEMVAEMKQALQRAIELKPDFADAYNLLAFAYGAEQDYAAAVEAMKQAVKLAPREDKYRDGLARYYLQLQRWDEAEPLLRGLTGSRDEKIAAGAKEQLQWLDGQRSREVPQK